MTDYDAVKAKAELYQLFGLYPASAKSLLARVEEGRLDGMSTCCDDCCVLGHIAQEKCKQAGVSRIVFAYNLRRLFPRPLARTLIEIEYMVQPLSPGDTPATNPTSALLRDWTRDWIREHCDEGHADAR